MVVLSCRPYDRHLNFDDLVTFISSCLKFYPDNGEAGAKFALEASSCVALGCFV